jgi:hypothetical protein
VLPGDYEVTLHFVEMASQPAEARAFGIQLEDEVVLDRYSPREAGVATADRRSSEIRDVDAILDVVFLPLRGSPRVCHERPRPLGPSGAPLENRGPPALDLTAST